MTSTNKQDALPQAPPQPKNLFGRSVAEHTAHSPGPFDFTDDSLKLVMEPHIVYARHGRLVGDKNTPKDLLARVLSADFQRAVKENTTFFNPKVIRLADSFLESIGLLR